MGWRSVRAGPQEGRRGFKTLRRAARPSPGALLRTSIPLYVSVPAAAAARSSYFYGAPAAVHGGGHFGAATPAPFEGPAAPLALPAAASAQGRYPRPPQACGAFVSSLGPLAFVSATIMRAMRGSCATGIAMSHPGAPGTLIGPRKGPSSTGFRGGAATAVTTSPARRGPLQARATATQAGGRRGGADPSCITASIKARPPTEPLAPQEAAPSTTLGAPSATAPGARGRASGLNAISGASGARVARRGGDRHPRSRGRARPAYGGGRPKPTRRAAGGRPTPVTGGTGGRAAGRGPRHAFAASRAAAVATAFGPFISPFGGPPVERARGAPSAVITGGGARARGAGGGRGSGGGPTPTAFHGAQLMTRPPRGGGPFASTGAGA